MGIESLYREDIFRAGRDFSFSHQVTGINKSKDKRENVSLYFRKFRLLSQNSHNFGYVPAQEGSDES